MAKAIERGREITPTTIPAMVSPTRPFLEIPSLMDAFQAVQKPENMEILIKPYLLLDYSEQS
jgi:hypothetical protein